MYSQRMEVSLQVFFVFIFIFKSKQGRYVVSVYVFYILGLNINHSSIHVCICIHIHTRAHRCESIMIFLFDMSSMTCQHFIQDTNKSTSLVTRQYDTSIINSEQGWLALLFSCGYYLIQQDVRMRLSPSKAAVATHIHRFCQHVKQPLDSACRAKNQCCKAHSRKSARTRLHSVQPETGELLRRSDSSNSAEMTLKGHCWYSKERFRSVT